MASLAQILILTAFFAGGVVLPLGCRAIGRGSFPPPVALERLIRGVLWALLFAMGCRIGAEQALWHRLGQLGLLAAEAAIAAVAGTLLIVWLSCLALEWFRGPARQPLTAANPTPLGATGASAAAHLAAPGLLLAMVLAGLGCGMLLGLPAGVDLGRVTGWTLDALLFLIGAQFAQADMPLRQLFTAAETLVVPLATAVGSLLGGLALAPFASCGPGKAMALTAGFGWYSLSGVLIANLGDPALGSVAFLANMLRESIALLCIPVLARTRYPVLAVGVGGATAMDVTLPLIEQCAGPAMVPVSFASGVLLSLAVPLLVPLLYGLN